MPQLIPRQHHFVAVFGSSDLDDDQNRVEMAGTTEGLEELCKEIELVAPTDARVLITGETGTGKTAIAHAIHLSSRRHKRNFRRTNVGALVPELAASQLFGHVKGAFTGATSDNAGIVREADTGTLFIDEVAAAHQSVQVMLLTLLESRVLNPVGAHKDEPRPRVDVRVISASIESPIKLRRTPGFRADLYYRLAEYHIELLPLRERSCEILPLAHYFLSRAHGLRAEMSPLRGLVDAASAKLQEHDWPGNIRELEHVVRAAVVRSRADPKATELRPEWISILRDETFDSYEFDGRITWRAARARFEQCWARDALRATDGVRRAAATKFQIDEKTLRRMLRNEPSAAQADDRRPS